MPTPFLTDTFSDTAGTNLSAHTPDTGGSWAYASGSPSSTMLITAAGRARNNYAGQSVAIDSVASIGNAATITWDLTPVSTAAGFFGVGIGASTTGILGYEARYDTGSAAWSIFGFGTGGVYSQLGSASTTLTAGATYHCQLVIPDPGVSTTKTLYVNGSAVLSVTDNTYPTSGRVYFDTYIAAAPTDSTGLQVDNVQAYNGAFTPGGTTTLAPDTAGIVFSPGNQYIVPGTSLEWIHTATGAKFDFTGTSLAAAIDLSLLTSGSISTSNYPYLNWSIDGGPWQRAQVAASVSLANGISAGTHSVEIRYEPDDESDTWTPHSAIRITGWTVDSTATISAPSGNATARARAAMLFGDSITRGYDAANIALDSFGMILAHALNAEIGITGYSGQGWGKAATSVAPAFRIHLRLL